MKLPAHLLLLPALFFISGKFVSGFPSPVGSGGSGFNLQLVSVSGKGDGRTAVIRFNAVLGAGDYKIYFKDIDQYTITRDLVGWVNIPVITQSFADLSGKQYAVHVEAYINGALAAKSATINIAGSGVGGLGGKGTLCWLGLATCKDKAGGPVINDPIP